MTQKKDRRITKTEDAFIRDDLEQMKFAQNYNQKRAFPRSLLRKIVRLKDE